MLAVRVCPFRAGEGRDVEVDADGHHVADVVDFKGSPECAVAAEGLVGGRYRRSILAGRSFLDLPANGLEAASAVTSTDKFTSLRHRY